MNFKGSRTIGGERENIAERAAAEGQEMVSCIFGRAGISARKLGKETSILIWSCYFWVNDMPPTAHLYSFCSFRSSIVKQDLN